MKKYICECGKEFDKIRGMTGHQSKCQIHKDFIRQQKESKRLPNGMFKCENPDCNNEHDGSYGSGRFCCEKCRRHATSLLSAKTAIKNGNKKRPENFKSKHLPYGTWKCQICGFIANTRKELELHKKQLNHKNHKTLSEQHKDKIRKSIKAAIKEGRCTGKASSIEKEELRRQKISNTMKKNPNAGGKRHGSGRGFQGWYKGIWCDSSWELAWVIYNLDHNIHFTRYDGYFEYEFNGTKHKYYPDFQLEDGTIVEIKGVEKSDQWKAKVFQFPLNKKLQIIGKYEISKYLDYVINLYGKDFIKLYENGELA